MSTATISPRELADAAQSGKTVELLDVRTPGEFQSVHVPFAKNVPLDQLDAAAVAARRNGGGAPVYVICRSGGRGRQAAEKLEAAGVREVFNVEGGTLAWEQAGLPVTRGKQVMSLERQVRIAAGSMVAIGTALGVFVHPYFLGLPAFVGCGLVFAGITDTCGMGMMLAKMPWNQVKATPTATEQAGACCSR